MPSKRDARLFGAVLSCFMALTILVCASEVRSLKQALWAIALLVICSAVIWDWWSSRHLP
jgi:hypothetical protein